MRVMNGVQYPDSTAMAFSPVLFVCVDGNADALEVTLTNKDGESVTVAHDTFDGGCYVDMSDYVQGLFGDVGFPSSYAASSASVMMHRMTYSVRKLANGGWTTAINEGITFFVWGALARGETWGCNRYYKRTPDKPFMVDLLRLGNQTFNFVGGGQSVTVTASAEGLWHVPIPSALEDAPLVLVDDSLGTAVVKMDGCDDGLLLRWIDRHGLLCHRCFYRGTETAQISQEGEYRRNNLIAWDGSYGWSGLSGDGYTRTRQDEINICADGATEEECRALMDLPSSQMVEMMDDDGNWMRVRIKAGSWTQRRVPMQDMEFVVIIDDVRIQKG